MLIRHPFVLLLSMMIFCCSNITAQFSPRDHALFSLRTNPMSWSESDANIMLGLDMQWSPRMAASFEPAYIYGRMFDTDNDGRDESGIQPASGLKLRSGIRFYFTDYEYGGKAFFFSPEFHYKYLTTKIWDEFGINCTGPNCAFTQVAQFKEIKTELGGLFKFGYSTRFFTPRVAMEVFAGLGVKQKKTHQTDFPLGGALLNPPGDRINMFVVRNGTAMMMPMGVKLSFALSRSL